MNHVTAAAAYKAGRFENAPPLKLVQLMYEGALRFLEQAEAALGAGEGARFQERCLRAHAVVCELRLALDSAQAPELVGQLEALYLFAEGEIRVAIASESPERLAPVRQTLATLLEAWKRIEVA